MAFLKGIPKYGFGTAFKLGDGEGETSEQDFRKLLRRAIELGCRHIDCAPLYGTQRIVGEVLKEFADVVPRTELFITSKLPVNMMQDDHIERSLRRTLEDLQLTYVDLFLIHAPFSTQHLSDENIYPIDQEGNLLLDESEGLLESAWTKLVDLKAKGLTKYIGLSNINLEQLIRLNHIHQVDVAQNEYHLFYQDREFFDFCEEIDVHYEAYAAFGCPPKAKRENKPSFLTCPTVQRIAKEYCLTPAQVIIQWLHQQPLSYIIRSDTISQLEENINATHNMTLSINSMIDLDSLNQNARLYLYDEYQGLTRHREYPFGEIDDHSGAKLDSLEETSEQIVAQVVSELLVVSEEAPQSEVVLQE